jgi:spore maturation protein SpmA
LLNRVWLALILASIAACLVRAATGDWTAVSAGQDALFSMAKFAAEIALGLVGLMTLWLGLFRIAEVSGVVGALANVFSPLFRRLMPEVPPGHPAIGSVSMNLIANMLGLDNAATPLGLRAMADLQSLNRTPDTLTNAQIMFLVINCSSVTLIPVSIFMYRAQMGAPAPADVFIPILLATSVSTLAGVTCVMVVQRLRPDPVLLAWALGLGLLVASGVAAMLGLGGETLQVISTRLAACVLLVMVGGIALAAVKRRIDAFEAFIAGAKEGFDTAVRLIPYLAAMLLAVGLLRASGLLDALLQGIRWSAAAAGFDTRFVDAMPVALMKPFSGSGARALMLETMKVHGVDSFPARLATIVQGSTETTFYVLSVYVGSVLVTRIRHALWCALFADAAGVMASIAVCYWFFG